MSINSRTSALSFCVSVLSSRMSRIISHETPDLTRLALIKPDTTLLTLAINIITPSVANPQTEIKKNKLTSIPLYIVKSAQKIKKNFTMYINMSMIEELENEPYIPGQGIRTMLGIENTKGTRHLPQRMHDYEKYYSPALKKLRGYSSIKELKEQERIEEEKRKKCEQYKERYDWFVNNFNEFSIDPKINLAGKVQLSQSQKIKPGKTELQKRDLYKVDFPISKSLSARVGVAPNGSIIKRIKEPHIDKKKDMVYMGVNYHF
jgi:hypothetical protein